MYKIFSIRCAILLVTILSLSSFLLKAQSTKVPGIVVDYVPASTKTFIGSPSICRLPNGKLVASHDYFGPASKEHEQASTAVFQSANNGKSWEKVSLIQGQFWSNLFVHQGLLYLMGTWKHHGNLIIRRSADGGKTWTEPTSSKAGLLREGEYHTAPMPMLIHNNRIWRAIENAKSDSKLWGFRYSAMMISAPVNADLLEASSWTTTNFLPHNPAYLDGKFRGWIEGNAVLTPDGKLVDYLRVSSTEKGREQAAIVNISEDGLIASFDPATGFLDFEGGAKKFSIRYDAKSKLYWTICNSSSSEFKNMDAGSVRNQLVIKSSPDLKKWTTHQLLLSHPDVLKHGFQYIDWQFDGNHIIYLSRTAWDDEEGGADNYHNANYLTFHRIKHFRKLKHRSMTND
jgi:hypothetical protein